MIEIKTKTDKKVDDYFKKVERSQIVINMTLKEEYPEDSTWLFNPDHELGFTIVYTTTTLFLTMCNSEIPKKTKKKLLKHYTKYYMRGFKMYNHIAGYFESRVNMHLLASIEKSNQLKIQDTGNIICSIINMYYELEGETWDYSNGFESRLGEITIIAQKQNELILED